MAVRADHVDAELLRVLSALAGIVAAPIGVAVGREGKPLTVRRPGWTEEAIGAGRIALHVLGAREVAQLLARDVKNPDIRPIAIARRHEGEARAIRRKRSRVVNRGGGDQGLGAGAVRATTEDVR